MEAISGTIVIVNAEPGDAERYARMLRAGVSEDLDIATAADIEEGLILCRESSPYCVLLAHEPPAVDGFGFLASLKFSGTATPPTVLIYGEGAFNVAGDAAKRGVDSYLTKSEMSEKLLVHAMRSAVEKAALRREVEELRSELVRLQFYDPVTGLATRRLFEDRAQHAIDRAIRVKGDLCLLLVELDGLGQLYESSGLIARDRVLREVGRRISGAIRQADVVARLDYDEFAVLMECGVSESGARTLAHRVLELLAEPFEIDAEIYSLGASVGISLLSSEAESGLVIAADTTGLRVDLEKPETNQPGPSKLAGQAAAKALKSSRKPTRKRRIAG